MLTCPSKLEKLPCDFKQKLQTLASFSGGVIPLFIHLSQKCLLSVCYAPYTLLGAGDRETSLYVHLLTVTTRFFV